jgi:hypothetical protein
MKIKIPGVSAGCAIPQHSCSCVHCRRAYASTDDIVATTHTQVASIEECTGAGGEPILIDSCADLLAQLSFERRDIVQGLDVPMRHFTPPETQLRALNILRFKLDALWSMLEEFDEA